jgi:pimeloyl-ACP methyl ester carboxylesterase
MTAGTSHCSKRWLFIAMGLVTAVAALVAAATRKGETVGSMTTTGTVKSKDGTPIAFTKLGRGPALILVDGALCFRENGPSRDIATALASDFTVYAYDRRGRGESGDTKPYAIDREIEDLKAVIRQAGDSAFVFGSSSGAVLAMQGVAAGLPIRSLVLYEPPLDAVRPGGPPFGEARRAVDSLVAAGDSAGAACYFLAAMLGTPRVLVMLMPVLMRRTWTKVMSVAHTLPYDLAILGDHSVVNLRAIDIRVPTLVIGGAKSPAFIRQAVERVARDLPNARALLLPGQSHDVSGAAEALAPVLRDFYTLGREPPAH